MKWLFLVAVILSGSFSLNLLAEDHQSETSSGSGHANAVKTQSKLYEYISACLAGRPVGNSLGSISLIPPSTPPTNVGPTSGREKLFLTVLVCIAMEAMAQDPILPC